MFSIRSKASPMNTHPLLPHRLPQVPNLPLIHHKLNLIHLHLASRVVLTILEVPLLFSNKKYKLDSSLLDKIKISKVYSFIKKNLLLL